MKVFALISAGLLASAGLAAAPASAQHHTVVHTRVVTHTRTHTRGHSRWKKVCRTYWHHHHKVRTCHRERTRW
ncbi:MAG: hypothetical protein ACTHMG_04935 [Sphingomonas sp.]